VSGLNEKDIEILFLKHKEHDEKVDINQFSTKTFRAVQAILLDKFKHSIVDY
jgi:hypothetical protein